MERDAATRTRFPSKRDAWLVAVIWVAMGVCVVGGVSQLESSAAPLARRLLLVFLLAAGAFMLWILYGTSYAIAGEVLAIRSGPFRFRVPLAEIDSVVPSRNPLSSPACSLDRLLITYREGRRRILVSPADKLGFLRALVSRSSRLVLDGDRVSRRGAA